MLISDYNDEFELIIVEIKLHNQQIRVISGYGPQETWCEAEILLSKPNVTQLNSTQTKATVKATSLG